MRRLRTKEKRERTPKVRVRRGAYESKKINMSPAMARNPTHRTGPNDHPAVSTAIAKDSPRISHPTTFSINKDGLEGRLGLPSMTWKCFGMARHKVNNPA